MKFKLLCAKQAAELEQLVNAYIEAGWRLHGITFFANAGYRQAIVRHEV